MPRETLKKRAGVALGLSVLVGVSFIVGLVMGNHRTFTWMNDVLETEVQGNLGTHIEVLSSLRAADMDRATGLMEERIGAAVISLPQGRQWEQIPASERRLLVIAKRYLAAYPPAVQSAALVEALARIPDEPLDPESCSPAVRRLLAGDGEGEE